MELTRRDAIAALTALGGGGVGYAAYRTSGGGTDAGSGSDTRAAERETVRATLVAAADVLYPSTVEGIEPFVTTFLDGRLDRPDHGENLRETVATLNRLAREWHDEAFRSLPPSTRDELLHEIGAATAEEHPDGTIAERVRYYVVNELLLALYASPTGGKLIGIENPQGHPGGLESYQRGPQSQ